MIQEDHKLNGDTLKEVEIETITKLQEDLYSPTTIDQFTGVKTKKILGILGVDSPSLKGAIKVSSRPNTWVVPREKITNKNRVAWIKRMKKKFRLR